jgi:hypothetical protein
MGTAVVGVDAFVAEAPFAFVTVVARPKATIGKRLTSVAELPFLQSRSRVRCRYYSTAASCSLACLRFDGPTGGRQVFSAHQDMWQLNQLATSAIWMRGLKLGLRRFAEPKPMVAATSRSVARQTQIHDTSGAMLVKFVLDIQARASGTRYRWFLVLGSGPCWQN